MCAADRHISLVGGTPWRGKAKKVQKTYFILGESDEGEVIKIGRAVNPIERMRALQTARTDKLRLLAVLPYDCEKEQHRRWDYLRIKKNLEWFRASESLRNYVRTIK